MIIWDGVEGNAIESFQTPRHYRTKSSKDKSVAADLQSLRGNVPSWNLKYQDASLVGDTHWRIRESHLPDTRA